MIFAPTALPFVLACSWIAELGSLAASLHDCSQNSVAISAEIFAWWNPNHDIAFIRYDLPLLEVISRTRPVCSSSSRRRRRMLEWVVISGC